MIRMIEIAFWLLLIQLGSLVAQETPPKVETPEVKEVSPLRKLMDESIDWFELYTDEQSSQPMTARVALRWANNTRGSEDGMTVLYLAAGRPEAVCCFFPWEKSLQHNFESLSRSTLIAKRKGAVVWLPEKPGVQFKPIPDAPIPADTPTARLRQMKNLSNQFSSTMLGWRSDSTDRESLRLLPQPLYRYESQRPEILDGCVFAFVQGTDPESLLLLEAFKTGDSFEWQYGFARRTSGELEGRLNDSVVWHANRYPANNNPRSTYFTLSHPLE
jgi:hypothetical protein